MRMNAEIHCSLKTKMARKSGRDSTNWYTQLSPKKLLLSWILLQYTSIESHSNLIIRGCLANTTPVYHFFSILDLSWVHPWTNPLSSSIHTDEYLNCWFSTSSVWRCLWGRLQSHTVSRIDKRNLHSARWTLSKSHNRFRLPWLV